MSQCLPQPRRSTLALRLPTTSQARAGNHSSCSARPQPPWQQLGKNHPRHSSWSHRQGSTDGWKPLCVTGPQWVSGRVSSSRVPLAAGSLLPTVGELVSLGVAAQPADGQVSWFLHDVPQLARECQLPLALHAARLHKHDLSAQGRPRQPYGHPGLVQPLRHLRGNTANSHEKHCKNNSIVSFETTVPIKTQKLSRVSDLFIVIYYLMQQ